VDKCGCVGGPSRGKTPSSINGGKYWALNLFHIVCDHGTLYHLI
jgi:hypothetical protein